MFRIAVTSRSLCPGDFLAKVEELAKGQDYQVLLLREKDMMETEYENLAREVLSIAGYYGKKCILHSFVGAAQRLGCPYLHLPLPVWEAVPEEKKGEVRTFFQEMGTSVHSVEQLERAVMLGADYVTAGHIFATDCKKGLAPRGLDFLREICEKSSVPVYGIGGITREREETVIRQGASGVCVMSGCMRN